MFWYFCQSVSQSVSSRLLLRGYFIFTSPFAIQDIEVKFVIFLWSRSVGWGFQLGFCYNKGFMTIKILENVLYSLESWYRHFFFRKRNFTIFLPWKDENHGPRNVWEWPACQDTWFSNCVTEQKNAKFEMFWHFCLFTRPNLTISVMKSRNWRNVRQINL